jgi:XTP/dITP diphosphohydrolase
MPLILIASNNKGKLREYRELLSPLGYQVVTPKDLNLDEEEIEENGTTYRENSLIKARYYRDLVDIPVISDDSGFEIDALGGFPGLFSARFAKEFDGDYERAGMALNAKLGARPRDARFRCTICYIKDKKSAPVFFEGDFPGLLLPHSSGHNGFGYDPFFHSTEYDLDMGLADEHVKNKISHRARALRKLLEYLSANA